MPLFISYLLFYYLISLLSSPLSLSLMHINCILSLFTSCSLSLFSLSHNDTFPGSSALGCRPLPSWVHCRHHQSYNCYNKCWLAIKLKTHTHNHNEKATLATTTIECLWVSWILNVLGFKELWIVISKFIRAVLRLWQWTIWRSKPWSEAFVF